MHGIYYNDKLVPSNITTKRYAYDAIVTIVDNWLHRTASIVDDNCVSLVGLRRIGKTTLLKQLCSYYKDRVVYIDGSEFNDDIGELYWDTKFKSHDIVCIDEVCKLSSDNKAELISLVKNGFKDKFFILTGSTPVVVRQIGDSICDGFTIEMPPITYAEHLMWKHEVSLSKVFKVSDYTQFITNITASQLTNEKVIDYLSGIVADSYDSYYNRCKSRFPKIMEHLRYHNDINLFFTYVASCQLLHQITYKSGIKIDANFKIVADKTMLSKEQDTLLRERISYLKNFKTKVDPELITEFCLMLQDAGLLHEVREYTTVQDDIIQKEFIPVYLFEMPQIIMNYYQQAAICKDLQADWVEHTILNAIARVYNTAGKYRTYTGDVEVDCVYGVTDIWRNKHCIIEVKDRPSSNIKLKPYNLMNLSNIQEFVITTNNVVYEKLNKLKYDNACFMRGDLLLLLFEVYYLETNGLPTGYEKIPTATELFDKYIKYDNNATTSLFN